MAPAALVIAEEARYSRLALCYSKDFGLQHSPHLLAIGTRIRATYHGVRSLRPRLELHVAAATVENALACALGDQVDGADHKDIEGDHERSAATDKPEHFSRVEHALRARAYHLLRAVRDGEIGVGVEAARLRGRRNGRDVRGEVELIKIARPTLDRDSSLRLGDAHERLAAGWHVQDVGAAGVEHFGVTGTVRWRLLLSCGRVGEDLDGEG